MAAGYPAPCVELQGSGVELAWSAVGVIEMEMPVRTATNCKPVAWKRVMPEWTCTSDEDCCARK